MLEREESVEQAYLFRSLGERLAQQIATQDLLLAIREELLATSRLPLAIEFLVGELKLHGVMAPAMARLGHYFTPFQTFVISEAESDRSRFDFSIAVDVLRREAEYRAAGASPQGVFLYQFEVLCRNRLGYDRGLIAVAGDPIFDAAWKEWLTVVRRQLGLFDISDMIYVRSEYYVRQKSQRRGSPVEPEKPVLFGEKEGRIAFANRRRDPLLLFAALQRHLNYPTVPRPAKPDESRDLLPSLLRRVERLESRLKLMEEENKGGIDITRFYNESTLRQRLEEPTDDGE